MFTESLSLLFILLFVFPFLPSILSLLSLCLACVCWGRAEDKLRRPFSAHPRYRLVCPENLTLLSRAHLVGFMAYLLVLGTRPSALCCLTSIQITTQALMFAGTLLTEPSPWSVSVYFLYILQVLRVAH